MTNSSRYFCNKECEYFPCHPGADPEHFNCLFCYCPMNPFSDCLGHPEYIVLADGSKIKDCTNCLFPHDPDHYDQIMQFLRDDHTI